MRKILAITLTVLIAISVYVGCSNDTELAGVKLPSAIGGKEQAVDLGNPSEKGYVKAGEEEIRIGASFTPKNKEAIVPMDEAGSVVLYSDASFTYVLSNNSGYYIILAAAPNTNGVITATTELGEFTYSNVPMIGDVADEFVINTDALTPEEMKASLDEKGYKFSKEYMLSDINYYEASVALAENEYFTVKDNKKSVEQSIVVSMGNGDYYLISFTAPDEFDVIRFDSDIVSERYLSAITPVKEDFIKFASV